MDQAYQIFENGGELGAQIRAKDWSRTAFGPIERWPRSLRSHVDVCLCSRQPAVLLWGPEFRALYNDAFGALLGERHPGALGSPGRDAWPDAWNLIAPTLNAAVDNRAMTVTDDVMLPVRRHGAVAEGYYIVSYAPIVDEHEQVAGVLAAACETTSRVIGMRRFALLQELAARMAVATTEEDACARAAGALGEDTADIPFAAFYLVDPRQRTAHLAASTGLADGSRAATASIRLDEPLDGAPWPLRAAQNGRAIVDDVTGRCGTLLVAPWEEPVQRAVVLPLLRGTGARPLAYLVLGLSPRLELDAHYTEFVDLVADQVSAAIRTARAFRAQKQRADELIERDCAKTTFFANVSHEFRTPLVLMLGPTEDALATPEQVLRGDALALVHRNEQRLLKLVNTLLDFSRVEAGRMQARFEPTHLAMLTADLASTFRSAMTRAGLDFHVDCVPTSDPVYVDREMWEKIVFNLLSNALKCTLTGTVSVRLRAEGDYAELQVEDTGVGIAAEELPHVFERFRPRGAHPRTLEGAGIGLPLVRELVQLNEGTIDVASAPGRGTTFSVRIPLRPGDSVMAEASRVSAAPRSYLREAGYVAEVMNWLPPMAGQGHPAVPVVTEAPCNAERVLFADGDAAVRDYVARLLRAHWNVETVSDGAEALAAARRSCPDLIIADVGMNGLDGFQLIKALRDDAQTADVSVLLLSGRADDEAIAMGLRAGADDYVVKPFSANALLVRVERQLAAARARAQARVLRDAERARLEAMFEDSPAAIALLRGPELIIELANPAMLEIWGREADVLGKPLAAAIPLLRSQGIEDHLFAVLATGESYHASAVPVRYDEHQNGILTDRYFDVIYAPVREAGGAISGVFVRAFNVTELVEQRHAAERANQVKDQFLATASHELKTPLSAIIGWAGLLREKPDDVAFRARALATIERNAKAQARLIDDMLDIARIESGKLRLVIDEVQVADCVGAAVDVVRPAAEDKGVHMLARVDDDAGTVAGDGDRLEQVIWNLLNNAVRYTPPDGTITVQARREGDESVIRVSDTGTGMPAEELAHVFERFHQVDNATTRQHGGLGLGLALVRTLVELHDGSVHVQSEVGQGTTFTIRLPLASESLAPGVPREPEVATP